jgi:uncharacterized protein YbcI
MSETQPTESAGVLAEISRAMVRLHKEQFGRGPTHARTDFAGRDTVVCTLEDVLLPAERAMVEMGEDQRVRESRTFLQAATAPLFVSTVEEILNREIRAFSSAVDPKADVVFEVFALQPPGPTSQSDGRGPTGDGRRTP